MVLATTRQRRPPTSSSPAIESYTKEDKPEKKLDGGEKTDDGSMSWKLPFFALVILRYMSATSNIIHDRDEVFNYWEPLHFLLFKSRFQTWEYRDGFYQWENYNPLSGVNKGMSGGLAISFSGCDDNQTSADTSVSGCFF